MLNEINNFVSQTNSELALLINGDWGIGKTYFIKNTVIPLIRDRSKKAYYISLHGVNNIDDIFSQILFQKSDFIQKLSQSKIGKITTSLFGSIYSIGLKNFPLLDLDINDIKLKASDIVKFEDSVIIFDDLERISSEVSFNDFIGKINNLFIDLDSVKVIFIANENEITGSGYSKIKEKTIGWTIDYKIRYADIVESLNQKYNQNDLLKVYLDEMEPFMIRILEYFDFKNIRTIIFFYDCLEIINSKIDLKTLSCKQDIFYSTFVLCIEYKLGHLDRLDMSEKVPYYISRHNRDISIPNHDAEETFLETRFTKYVGNSLMTEYNYEFEYYFAKSIFRLIIQGEIDESNLQRDILELDTHKKKGLSSEFYKSCKKLQSVFYISNEDFKSNLDVVMKGLKNKSINLNEFILGIKVLSHLATKPELRVSMKDIERIVDMILNENSFEQEKNYLSLTFINRYLADIAKYNETLAQKIEIFINAIQTQQEQKGHLKKWKEEIYNIRDGRTMLKILQYVTEQDLLNKILSNLGNPTFLSHFSMLINRAFGGDNIHFPIYKEQLSKFRFIKESLEGIATNEECELVELLWTNELIKEMNIILSRRSDKVKE